METTETSAAATQTRGGLLGRLAVLAGGAVGLGWAAGDAWPRRGLKAPRPGKQQSFVLRGRNWRLNAVGRPHGRLPAATESAVPVGALVDAKGGALGRFRAAPLPGPATIFQFHTFELADGSLLGVGGGSLGESVYAVVGGTGRYAGASGSYVARQFPREAGGDGTAEFTFTIKVPEA